MHAFYSVSARACPARRRRRSTRDAQGTAVSRLHLTRTEFNLLSCFCATAAVRRARRLPARLGLTSARPRTRSGYTSATCGGNWRRTASRGCCIRCAASVTRFARSNELPPKDHAADRARDRGHSRRHVGGRLAGCQARALRPARLDARRTGTVWLLRRRLHGRRAPGRRPERAALQGVLPIDAYSRRYRPGAEATDATTPASPSAA